MSVYGANYIPARALAVSGAHQGKLAHSIGVIRTGSTRKTCKVIKKQVTLVQDMRRYQKGGFCLQLRLKDHKPTALVIDKRTNNSA